VANVWSDYWDNRTFNMWPSIPYFGEQSTYQMLATSLWFAHKWCSSSAWYAMELDLTKGVHHRHRRHLTDRTLTLVGAHIIDATKGEQTPTLQYWHWTQHLTDRTLTLAAAHIIRYACHLARAYEHHEGRPNVQEGDWGCLPTFRRHRLKSG
jgi:hypothetical protein